MTITDNNGYIRYSVEEDEIIIDNVESYEKCRGTGSKLVQQVIEIAKQENKNISICAYPQDDSIEFSDLVEFYERLGFGVEYDTGDSVLMTYAI